MFVCLCLFCRCVVLTHQEHLGVTYIFLNEDPSPRMLIHNQCPVPLLLKEAVKGGDIFDGTSHPSVLLSQMFKPSNISFLIPIEVPRTEVHCRLLEAQCFVHHELYHQFSTFPECRQKDLLPSLLLKRPTGQESHDWTEPIDVNCPGTQVNSLILD